MIFEVGTGILMPNSYLTDISMTFFDVLDTLLTDMFSSSLLLSFNIFAKLRSKGSSDILVLTTQPLSFPLFLGSKGFLLVSPPLYYYFFYCFYNFIYFILCKFTHKIIYKKTITINIINICTKCTFRKILFIF